MPWLLRSTDFFFGPRRQRLRYVTFTPVPRVRGSPIDILFCIRLHTRSLTCMLTWILSVSRFSRKVTAFFFLFFLRLNERRVFHERLCWYIYHFYNILVSGVLSIRKLFYDVCTVAFFFAKHVGNILFDLPYRRSTLNEQCLSCIFFDKQNKLERSAVRLQNEFAV